MQTITAAQMPVADNPHGVDVRHLYKTKDVVVSQITLQPGEIVECDIEVWATSIVIRKGNLLRVDIQPRDGVGSAPYTHYHAEYNAGAQNTIFAGGDTVLGPQTVAKAVCQGLDAAESMHRYMQGQI